MKKYSHFLLFATFCILIFSRCTQEKPKPIVLVAEPDYVNEEVVGLIRKQLSGFDTLKTLFIADDSLLQQS